MQSLRHPQLQAPRASRSLMLRIAQSRLVQTTALGSALFGITSCGLPTSDDSGRGDATPGVQVKSNVLIIANADQYPNTSIQCILDTAIFSNTRTGDPQKIVPDQPDLCLAVAQTLKNHPTTDGNAVQVDHLDCPEAFINPNISRQLSIADSFGLC